MYLKRIVVQKHYSNKIAHLGQFAITVTTQSIKSGHGFHLYYQIDTICTKLNLLVTQFLPKQITAQSYNRFSRRSGQYIFYVAAILDVNISMICINLNLLVIPILPTNYSPILPTNYSLIISSGEKAGSRFSRQLPWHYLALFVQT